MEKGLAASTLKVQVAALSFFLEKTLSREPLIICYFFKAMPRNRPIPLKFFPSWDLSLVLQGLMKVPFEPLEDASLKVLTLKTILLLAVTSARGISEIQALSNAEPFFRCLPDRSRFSSKGVFHVPLHTGDYATDILSSTLRPRRRGFSHRCQKVSLEIPENNKKHLPCLFSQ